MLSLPVFALNVIDDVGRSIDIAKTPSHVVSLAPHLTELIYTAGGGHSLVGVSLYSDYPPQASRLPLVSDATHIDFEKIVLLETDFVFAWESAISKRDIEKLQNLHIPVYISKPEQLTDIGKTLHNMAIIFASAEGHQNAEDFFKFLQKMQRPRTSLQVFIQIASNPLYTVNKHQLISRVVELCGGNNIFAELPIIAPVISAEALLSRPMDLVLSTVPEFQAKGQLEALVQNTVPVLYVEATSLVRPSLRIQAGIQSVCTAMDRLVH